MKKSTLLLSALVVISSAAPVVAMQTGEGLHNNQQPPRSPMAQMMRNMVRLDLVEKSIKSIDKGISQVSSWFKELGLVGNSQGQSFKTAFNQTSEDFQNSVKNTRFSFFSKNNLVKMALMGIFGVMALNYLFAESEAPANH